jgi:hypothetical protein
MALTSPWKLKREKRLLRLNVATLTIMVSPSVRLFAVVLEMTPELRD